MNESTFRDGDLLICGGYTTGLVLETVSAADVAVSVVVAGPTFDREYAGMSFREFARENPDTDLRLLLPQGETIELLATGQASYVPSRAPDQPAIVRRWMAAADRTVGVFEASEPRNGTITPGACGVLVSTILNGADVVIAEVNRRAPRLPGLTFGVDSIDIQVHAAPALPTVAVRDRTETTAAIARTVAEVIPDGATLEIGIGSIPDAVVRALEDHEDLGLHGGFVGPAARDLVESGIAQRGNVLADPVEGGPLDRPLLANTVLGDGPAFYDWAEQSGAVALGTLQMTTHTPLVRENPAFTAINGALQVDLLGQVNAERLGHRQVSVTGGQPAYLRAARESPEGVGIVALTSAVEDGPSKIVPSIPAHGAVTTSRVDPDVVVTEHGVAELCGATVAERASELVGVADPAHRQSLRETAREHGLLG